MAVLSVVFMALHPTTGTHDPVEFVTRAGRGVPGNTLVHGVLITLVLMMFICFLSLRDVLGSGRLLVRAGLVALVVGTTGAVVAGLINGFIIPSGASHFAGAEPQRVESALAVMTLAREAGATCARVGVVGLSLGAIAWAWCLLAFGGWRRAAGVAGIVCGVTPMAMHVGEHLRMNVPGFGLFVLIYAVWAVIAGIVLLRWQSPSPTMPRTA